jgi:ectoine hydroxylase-related dioxygenase (phytanoyl-CoA dioxygenase family)
MTTQPTNTRESLAHARRDTTDWSSLTTADRIRSIELEGYVVIPDLLDPPLIRAILAEVGRLETTPTDYSEHQRGRSHVEATDSPATVGIVALPATIAFLTALFGDDLVCTSCMYGESRPGHPGIAIHTDSQPYGSKIFGVEASSPCLVRVLYYLDDLTPERSPLKVIPRSHLSLHRDANPYNRYLAHEDEVMVTCKAGSAAIINQKVFHANYPNYSDTNRRMLAIAYRPAWAGPIAQVADHDPAVIARLPAEVRRYFKSLNTRNIDFDVPNRPGNLDRPAVGLRPGRWSA